MPWAAWKASTTGMIVVVSARLPSRQPAWRGTMTVDSGPDDLGAAPPVLGVTHPPQIILALGLEVGVVRSYRHRAEPHWR